MSYKDDVGEEMCDYADLIRGDRNDDYNLEKEVYGCLDINNDSAARACRRVYTIYCATSSGQS